MQQLLKNVKRGEFITFKEIESPTDMQVYVKGPYDRATKKYECYCFGDISKYKMVKGDKLVYTDFTF